MLLFSQGLMAGNPEELWVKPRIYQGEKTSQNPLLHQLRSVLSPKRGLHVELETLSDKKILESMKSPGTGPSKIGFSRKVEALGTSASVSSGLAWTQEADGSSIGHLSIRSPGAKALRVGLHFDQLPEGAELRFHDEGLQQIEPVDATQIRSLLQKNADSGDHSPEAEVYWSPIIQGEVIGIEVSLPKGMAPDAIAFRIEGISHLTVNPGSSERSGLNALAAAGSCNMDSRCYPNWSATLNAVARISFVTGGSSYLCTGTLLNDSAGTNTPYFLTANHCISSQTAASTLSSYWFYYDSACNSGQMNSGMTVMSQGASLLYAASTTDASFLRLNGTLPAGVTFAGWTNTTPPIGVLAAGIHHPQGDLQKMSLGVTADYDSCLAGQNESFSCNISNSASSTFINVTMSTGTTEPGSSGSGIFLESNQFLFGQLYGGDSSCSNLAGDNYYGLFSKTYQNGQLGQWLGAPKQNQTITLSLPQSLTVNSSVTVSASSSSGLPVVLTSTSPTICSISNTTLTGVTPGTCSILGTQSGNANYASTTANSSLTVIPVSPAARNPQTITVSLPPSLAWGTSAPFSANASSGLTTITSSKTPLICSVSDSTVLGLYPGVCTVVTSQSGDLNYAPATAEASTQVSLPIYPKPTTKLNISIRGSGKVTSNPVGIDCGLYCSQAFSRGSKVVLEAVPSNQGSFIKWQGACTGTSPTCTLILKGNAKSAKAMFR